MTDEAKKEEAETKKEERRKRALERQQYVTGRIGDTCRVIGFGLVALFYTMHGAGTGLAKYATTHHSGLVFMMGFCGILVIISDYLQYVASARSVNEALLREKDGYTYNDKSIAYILNGAFYIGKQVLAGAGAFLAGVVIVLGAINGK